MNNLNPGDVVSVMIGLIEHFGIVSDRQIDGMLSIISNSRRTGQVAEEAANAFAAGKTIKVYGYPSTLMPATVIARARSQLGKPYSLATWNCEHFIRWAHGSKVVSPQLQVAVIASLVLLGLFYWVKHR